MECEERIVGMRLRHPLKAIVMGKDRGGPCKHQGHLIMFLPPIKHSLCKEGLGIQILLLVVPGRVA